MHVMKKAQSRGIAAGKKIADRGMGSPKNAAALYESQEVERWKRAQGFSREITT